MPDPAPPAYPSPASQRRPRAKDQMAALSGESVAAEHRESDQDIPVDPEPVQARETAELPNRAPVDATTPRSPVDRASAIHSPVDSDPAAAPISPPAPNSATVPQADRAPPQPRSPPPSPRNATTPASRDAQEDPNAGTQSSHQTQPLTAAAMVAAALTGGFRRPETRASSVASTSASESNPAPSLLDRLSVKSLLDSLRRSQPRASEAHTATPYAATAATPTPGGATPKPGGAPPPAGGLRDRLGVFTADRMQARRDAEQIRGATHSGTAVLASLEALERQETTGILLKIRDAANANGGIERVLSEMRPGGAFEDLRKEFNIALSHDEGFATAYEKAAGALSSYAETRAGMISAPRSRADINLARLETLDQEIGAAAKTLPGVKDGKNALDEALEGGKEAIEKAFSAIRQAFTRDTVVRGPSPSPSFGP